jgi:hypothetical protein
MAFRVYCKTCCSFIYIWKVDKIVEFNTSIFAEDFVPACADIRQPTSADKMICPRCGLDSDKGKRWAYFKAEA